MRVFVTGATGFVGSLIAKELIRAGHRVTGLARSDASAKALEAAGAQVLRGSLEDLDCLKRGASASDGVIHTGFNHDFSKFKEICETDRKAVGALGAGLLGSSRPLIITSALGVMPSGQLGTENMMPPSDSEMPRAATEQAAQALIDQGVHVSVIRLALSVHGKGDWAFVPMLIRLAREKGVSAYEGKGLNRWPAVHREDSAVLYRLALEKGAKGAYYHGVAEEGVTVREIAEVIGRRLNLPVVSKSAEEAASHFGFLAHFVEMDLPSSSKQTQEQLGWRPTQVGLIADIEKNYDFS